MVGVYCGLFMYVIGIVMTMLSLNVEVPMSGDFCDFPVKIKIGLLCIFIGVLVIAFSGLFMVSTNPLVLLER